MLIQKLYNLCHIKIFGRCVLLLHLSHFSHTTSILKIMIYHLYSSISSLLFAFYVIYDTSGGRFKKSLSPGANSPCLHSESHSVS